MTSLAQFDDLILSRSILTHPYYKVKWNNGELTLDDLQIYAKEYFHLARRIPGIVSRVRDRAMERGDTADLLPHISENLEEETEHVELWKRFAKSLGVSEAEIEAYEPSAKVQKAVTQLETLAGGSFEDGVAVMYALELDLPAVAKSKKEGLCKHYDLTSEDAHVYFDEHLNEEAHFGVWRQVEVDPDKAAPIIAAAMDAQHLVLDGVCEASGIDVSDCDCS